MKSAPRPFAVTVQPWGSDYRADLLVGSTIYATGYGKSEETARADLRRVCAGTPWEVDVA